MYFTQMQERLRVEIVRRIQRGTLTLSLLARQTGFGQSHLSNFLHARRQLSLEAMDRILAAQELTTADLLPSGGRRFAPLSVQDQSAVPIVSHGMALFEPYIRPAAVQSIFQLPDAALHSLRTRANASRRHWQRFVAIRIAAVDAQPMDPLVLPDALAIVDRHYNSLAQYASDRPTLYAIRKGAHLTLRYADFIATRLVLRPHNLAFPIDLVEIEDQAAPNDYIAGRVVLIPNAT